MAISGLIDINDVDNWRSGLSLVWDTVRIRFVLLDGEGDGDSGIIRSDKRIGLLRSGCFGILTELSTRTGVG